ncbi:MAG: DUF362 domain-containing protein [Verrucomicrobia bacterium]|nr:DUF362 domain-containing protein [Verrucomicrobiota bacterium]
MASTLVIWLLGIKCGLLASLRLWVRGNRLRPGLALGSVACLLGLAAMAANEAVKRLGDSPRPLIWTPSDPPNSPIGVPKGIFPGRVTWLRDTNATLWNGVTGLWYATNGISQDTVDRMMSRSLRGLTGTTTDEQAWDQIFGYYNTSHGRANLGYQTNEAIAVKINCNNADTGGGYSKSDNQADASPQTVLALVRQLVSHAHVPQNRITVYDASRPIRDCITYPTWSEFRDVVWADSQGGYPHTRNVWVTNAFSYSTNNSGFGNSIPQCVAQATYLINLAIFKGHATAGVTLTAKNHYGSINARDHAAYVNAFQHPMGTYHPFVDLIGTTNLGGKTALYLIDGLYSVPYERDYIKNANGRWTNIFNGQWPASMFASFDPVAIDSVGLDFLRSEYGDRLGRSATGSGVANGATNADNFLHEAAQADQPPSGTIYKPDGFRLASLGVHEHWNNATAKQYSRNLDTNAIGIELLALHAVPAMTVTITSPTNGEFLSLETNLVLQAAITTNYSSIQRVDFYRRTDFIGTVTNSPFNLVWSNAPAGAWPLWCVALDADTFGVTSAVVNVTIGAPTNVPPFILGQPEGQTATLGGSVTFGVDAGGYPVPAYQWRKDSVDMVGATGSTLLLPGLTATAAGLYSVQVSNAAGALTSADARLTMVVRPPKAIYAFEGDVLDSSGNANHGTNNGATFVTGKIGGQAAQFNGSNAWVLVPASISGSYFSIAIWVRTTDVGDTGQWYAGNALVDDKFTSTFYDFGTALCGGKFAFGTGNPDITLTSTGIINDGVWHHVAATWAGSGVMQLFVDGNLDCTGTNQGLSRWPFPGGLHIGNGCTGGHYFNGALDDVQFYDRVLAASEIAALAGTAVPVFPTGLSVAGGDGQVGLRWNYATGAASYSVKRASAINGPYVVVTNGVITTSFTNTGLINETPYYFVVSAANSAGDSVDSAVVSATPHGPPQIGVSFAPSGSQLSLSWPGWATNYTVYATTNLAFPGWWPVTNAQQASNGLRYLNLPATNDGPWFFRLRSP